ncbi:MULTISPECIES: hypothetical protein [unclassified Streptococcus]|uniref:hypothetical protein n=1 Tax=unclassified Streptococcus TaxID=2608887 RepID=UPI001071DA08|nr:MULTISPECIES: hypothetical protein [unclassified Streptococcus]MBF0786840.1 hypothetical protein [Streptococcus sp. 19428wC2_LYSM12]MCQ9212751.1 hypothetical protein [Streptococcus sp. B01]MCQ9214092.1 hypothetical protein [Streptococcus sp. O1]TFV06212.1 hypothetical protein E4T79_02770 [Streptococcus sp. LYSM12]
MFEKQAANLISKLLPKKEIENGAEIDLIASEIQLMMASFDTRVPFFPTYPRIIIDSWNFDDELELELLRLNEYYKRIISEWK